VITQGGTASAAAILSGGTEFVSAGGTAVGTIDSGGQEPRSTSCTAPRETVTPLATPPDETI
jgi:antigen 43